MYEFQISVVTLNMSSSENKDFTIIIPSIYAEIYIVFTCSFVRALRTWNLPQSFSQSCVKVSQVGYIS